MTKEELEKEAEEYARNTYEMCSYSGLPYASDRRARQQAFLAGAEPREKRIVELEAQIGKMKVKWHDLEKDPNDLPKNCKTMCICLGDFGSKYQSVPQVCIGYCDSLGWSDYMGSSLYSTVRYWCELP